MTLFRVIHKFGTVLSKHQKLRIFEIIILMIIGGFLEMMSVSLILPFMEAVMEPKRIMSNVYVSQICVFFGISSERSFLFFLALLMAALYIIKNAFLIFQLNTQSRFVYNNMFLTQQKLLDSYMVRPYSYFLNIKSGEIIRIVGTDTANSFALLSSILSLFTEAVVTSTLIITVLFISPGITLAIAGVLGALVCLIMLFIRPVLQRSGEINHEANSKMNQWMLQMIQGIKDIKISRREGFFKTKFEESGKQYVKTNRQHQVLSVVPRFLIEAIAMGVFFVCIAFFIYRGMKFEEMIPILSAVAMAAVRLLPSVNRISQSMAGVVFGEATVDKLIEHIFDADQATKDSALENECDSNDLTIINRIKEGDCIELRDITFKYPTGNRNVLSKANMSVICGESVGVVGASGAGKTTAIDIILGLLKPSAGKVLVAGEEISRDMENWLNQVSYIPQSIFMLDGSVKENVAFGIREEEVDDERVWKALKEAAIDKDVEQFPHGLDTELGERGIRLSGGQRQRIGIARALYSNPSVLVFDEATSALDNDTEAAIMESIHNLHGTKTMIIIAHRLSTIESCDHIFRVEDGKIIKER